MTVVELTYRKNGRIAGREACLLRNEGVTLSGRFPSRAAELRAFGYEVTRTLRRSWPAWTTTKRGSR